MYLLEVMYSFIQRIFHPIPSFPPPVSWSLYTLYYILYYLPLPSGTVQQECFEGENYRELVKKHSCIACLYHLQSAEPSNNYGENFR